MAFTHLHVHSHYSLLNGLPKIKPLVKAAKERGFSALALTDYHALYGAIEFYQTCLAEGVKPIIGFEALVEAGETNEPFGLVLLAENYAGYRNLMVLSSLGFVSGFKGGAPRITHEMLFQHSNGLIALSGSLNGEIPRLLLLGKDAEARNALERYRTGFPASNFYLELQDHPGIPGQLELNTKMIQLAQETGVSMVATRDVHYLNPEDAEAQDILRCIGKGWRVDQTNREDVRHVDRSLNSEEDIASRFRHLPEALANTGAIAERVAIEIPLNQWHFAPVELPPGKTADEVLRESATKALPSYYSALTEELKARFDYELNIIEKKGFSPYFLCVADYVRYAKEHGIVESTRGSAAGSLVSYVLGITTVDPIRFKLPFERFLNPYRPSPPDIDTDFADDRRGEMINYVTKKYGEDRVAQIITFGTMAARASVRDVGRALGLSYSFCDQLAKLIPFGVQGFPMTIQRALTEEPDLKKLYETNADVKRLLDLARKVEGCARHTSIHAAGVVIAPTRLTDFTPIQRETGGEKIITQYEMKSVEAAGLLKNDFLGIRNLAILGNAVEIVKATTGEIVDIYHLPLDDKKVFEMLSRGETMGVFQLGSSGMTRWLKELKPSTIDDIMAMVALYRPGPMDVIPKYIHRKHDPTTISYLDPRMASYLQTSFGLLVYQDDVLLTAIELAGYNWEEADKFRKAIGKKIPEEMAMQKIKFYQGCRDHGHLKNAVIDQLWQAIEPFAAYGFNKAHAASYGIVAYQTGYMKAHYPVQYMTAVLVAEAGDADKVAAIIHECSRMGIAVLPPDVNESFRNFAMVSKPGEAGRIRFGLTAIKNVGEHICEVIYRERKMNGPYESPENFLRRIDDKDLNKKSLESLIQAGALDCFGHDRGVLLVTIEQMLLFLKQIRSEKDRQQASLFSLTHTAFEPRLSLTGGDPATMADKLHWEKSLLGIYVSSHPFREIGKKLKDAATSLAELDLFRRDAWITTGGVIENVKKKITKKGQVMLVVRIADESGSAEYLVFPKTYETTKEIWKEGETVLVIGKTPKEEGENTIFVEKVYPIHEENAEDIARYIRLGEPASQASERREPNIILRIRKEEIPKKTPELKRLFAAYPGPYRVYLVSGSHTVRTATSILWNEEVGRELRELLGEQSVTFEDD